MTVRERERERSRVLAGAATGAVVGLIAAALDLVLAARWQGTLAPPPWPSRLMAVGLVSCAGVIGGVLGAGLRGPWGAIWPATLTWLLGTTAAAGPRASRMWLAPWWGEMAGAAVLVGACLLPAVRRRLPRATALVLGAGAIAVYVTAAFVQRGRYHDMRALAVALAFCAAFAALRSSVSRRPRPVLAALVVVAAAGGPAGLVRVAHDAPTFAWVERCATATQWYAHHARSLLAPPLPDEPVAALDRAPFFETPLADETREALGAVRGVLLVTVDAWRGDLLGRDVGGRAVSPFVDALAARGARFDRAYAPAVASQMSLFATFTGLYPTQILSAPGGVRAVPLITERLGRAGVATRAIFADAVTTVRPAGFTRDDYGFATVRRQPFDDPDVQTIWNAIRPAAGERWFSWVHLMLPHHPYDGAAEAFRAGEGDFERYAAEVRHCDDVIRELVERLRRAGAADDALVVVSADHGEEFMEHGRTAHGAQLFEESSRVPLVVSGRGVVAARHTAPVSLVDLAPTLDHLFGLPAADRPGYAGRSLVPALVGRTDDGRVPWVLSECPPLGAPLMPVQTALVGERWKLIVDERLRRMSLFDLEADPSERRDLAPSDPDRARWLWSRLRALRSAVVPVREELFTRLTGAERLVSLAELVSPDRAAAVLLGQANLEDEAVVAGFCYLVDDPDPGWARQLVKRFGSLAHPDVATASALLSAAAGLPFERDDLLRRVTSSPRADVRRAAWVVFERLADGGLLEARMPSVQGDDLCVALARASCRRTLRGEAPPAQLVERARRHRDPWVRRHAVRLTEDLPALRRLYASLDRREDRPVRLLGAIIEECAKDGSAETTAWLSGLVRRGDLDHERGVAAAALLRREPEPAWTRLDIPGIVRDRITIELQPMPEQVSLILLARASTSGPARIELRTAEWRGIVARATERVGWPVVFRLPAGVTSMTLEVRGEIEVKGAYLLP